MPRFSIIFISYTLFALLCYALSVDSNLGSSEFLDFISISSTQAEWDFFLTGLIFFLGLITSENLGIRLFPSAGEYVIPSFNPDSFRHKEKILGATITLYTVAMLAAYIFAGKALWLRDYYHLASENKLESEAAGSIWDLVGAMGMLLLGLGLPILRFFYSAPTWRQRMILRVLLLLDLVFLYGTGSKVVAAILGLYLIAGSINKSNKPNILRLSFFVLPLILLALVLAQRAEQHYGILTIPTSFGMLCDRPLETLEYGLRVIGSAIPIVAETKRDVEPSFDFLMIELNPMSGFASGWYKIYDLRRLNFAIPYSALGTLAGYSWTLLFLYGLVWGGVMLHLRNILTKSFGAGGELSFLIASIFFCGMFGQYNLRSVNRYMYYMLVIFAVVTFFRQLKGKHEAAIAN